MSNEIDFFVEEGIDLYTKLFNSLNKINLDKNELKEQYKRMSFKLHPDKNPGNEEVAKAMFQQLSNAFQILNNDNLRIRYDQLFAARAARAAARAAPSAPAAAAAAAAAPSAFDMFGMVGAPAAKNPRRFAHSPLSIYRILKEQMEADHKEQAKQRPQLPAPPPQSMFNSPGGIEGSVTFGSMTRPPGGAGMGGYKKRKYYSYNRRSNKRLNKKSSKNKRHAMKRRGYNSYKIKKQ
jgi:curved DNA-binding protein CbpA